MNVGLQENYVASSDDITTPHGMQVLILAWAASQRSTFDFHRIVAKDGTFKPSNFLKAMQRVRESNPDLVNLSGGVHHHNCQQKCRICVASKSVVNEGIPIVAGAGNSDPNESKSLYCPAAADTVIAVGAFETVCSWDVQPRNTGRAGLYRSNLSTKSPGSYWVDSASDSQPYSRYDTAFCGARGCSPMHPCEDFSKERLWEGNVNFGTDEPDVFAPHHFVKTNGDLDCGTSFSTAIVAGGIADVLSRVENGADVVEPRDIQWAIEMLESTVGDTSHTKLDISGLLGYLD